MELYHNLLPLPSGYFGASSALYNLNGLIIIYGPAGGAWHINIEDEPRWYRNKTKLLGAGLLEMDVILGRDTAFVDRIVEVASDLKRSFVAILGTPVSAITGIDLKGISKAVQKRLNIPVLYINTIGSEDYCIGAKKAFLELAKYFVDREYITENKTINILGAIHLDIGRSSHLNPMLELIQQCNFQIKSIWGIDSCISKIKNCAGAELNIVLTSSGLSVAKWMYNQFNVPYILGFPVGKRAVEKFKRILEGKYNYSNLTKTSKIDKKVLIVGEPVISYSIKTFLKKELGLKDVIVLSRTPIDELFSAEGVIYSFLEKGGEDIYTSVESEISKVINQDEIDIVIADPYYRILIKNKKIFIPLPHIAVSARFYWDSSYEFIGLTGGEYLKQYFCN